MPKEGRSGFISRTSSGGWGHGGPEARPGNILRCLSGLWEGSRNGPAILALSSPLSTAGGRGGGHPPEPGHSWRRMFSGQMRRSQRISAQGTKGWREGYERGSEGGWCCWLHNVRNVFNNTELHVSEWSRQ